MKTIKEITDYALRLCVAKGPIRMAMTRPYNNENGFTYATDAFVLLCVPSEYCMQYEPFKEYRFPDVAKVVDDTKSSCLDRVDYIHTGELCEIRNDASISGIVIRNSSYSTLCDVTRILGLEGWTVRSDGKQMLLLNNGMYVLIICGLLESKNYTVIHTDGFDFRHGTDIDMAEAAISVIEERVKKEEAQADRRKCIYTFTVVRYATMYVKADNLDEAKRIANSHCSSVDSWDFGHPEVDSFDEYPEEPDSSMGTIFTEDGESTYDDVMEELEEELD